MAEINQDKIQPNTEASPSQWERETLQKLLFTGIQEQRRSRRWGILFKSLTFLYLLVLLVLLIPTDLKKIASEHTALVEVKGVIADDTEASADRVVTGLRAAFKDSKTKGVILRINSPGGSAVQAGYVNDEIHRLKKKYPKIPLYAVVTDVCASGGYYIAAAADKVFVDKASLVGSIGVIMSNFGFVEAINKLGVERRLMTAGEHKAILDPFSPASEFDRTHIQSMLDKIHQQFISVVKQGRGERLSQDEALFSGLIWTGEEAIKLGLADELGSSSFVAREIIKAEDIVDFTSKEDLAERFAKRFGAGVASALARISGLGLEPQL